MDVHDAANQSLKLSTKISIDTEVNKNKNNKINDCCQYCDKCSNLNDHYNNVEEQNKDDNKNNLDNQIVNINSFGWNKAFQKQNNNRFSEWIHCMCIVTFDLELGQAMEDIYPKTAVLSEQEKMNICYLAFPDSNSSCMGDTQYHVRLRLSSDNIDLFTSNPIQQKFSSECIPVQKPDLAHYWGFVYFRQKKDKTIPRGYFQKSFIILTRLPFFNLFNEIVSAIAPRYFNDGKKILEIVYDQINNWPTLKAGESYSLNLLGTFYETIIPKSNSKTHNNTICKINSNKSNNLLNKCNERSIIDVNDKIKKKDDKNNFQTDDLCKKCKNVVKKDKKPHILEFVGPQLPPQVLNSVHEIDIFRSLSFYITSIYTLWELVLTAEPIVVMGSSPTDCSHMVQSLISLIYPLCYLAQHRPYFTIHDSEFREFTSPSTNFSDYNLKNVNSRKNETTSQMLIQSIPPSIILGVTNPFFGKLLKHWPNMIKLPDNTQQIYSIISKFSSNNSNNLKNSESSHNYNSLDYYNNPSTIKMKSTEMSTNHSSGNNNNSSAANTNLINIVTGGGNNDSNNTPGFYSKYKPFLKKDKLLIKKIELGIKTKRPEQAQSALLRRHFLELTQSFMIPLESYMASLMPLQKDISPFKAAPNPNEFKQDEFLARLEQAGPHLTSSLKGNWKGLYKRFFKSPNFKGWYENRYKELKQTLQEIQLQVLSDADLNQWAQGKLEVEIVDMIIKLKEKLMLCPTDDCPFVENDDVIRSPTRIQLLKQIDNITQSLPDDLKIIIQKST